LRHGEAAPASNEMDELYKDPGAPSPAPGAPTSTTPAPGIR
jgi:hypothetical protein